MDLALPAFGQKDKGETCMFRAGALALGSLPWGIRTLCVKLRGLGDGRVRWFSYRPTRVRPTLDLYLISFFPYTLQIHMPRVKVGCNVHWTRPTTTAVYSGETERTACRTQRGTPQRATSATDVKCMYYSTEA